MSQEGLGELTGLNRTYISDIERGTRNVSIVVLIKLATALKTGTWQVIRELEKPREGAESY